ncbi:hypothetical protein UE46_12015 [Listeria weihenstephanensis]|uniref:Uncharacterized protein n=1 Tax=Listeria weihenstephanensis TaxID=1006155 RepID=A0A1S7FW63_9LIST|nr:hypothetical protein [Listeria weihenstephanensis]AQY51686.1 hypothetical protein UE46_12015 [Listeria weihenstephanensis]
MTRKVRLNILGCIIAGGVGILIFVPNYPFPDMYRILIFMALFMINFYINRYLRERKEGK